MKLSPEYKKRIADEFKFVLDKMKAKIPISEKMYYLSAIHGCLNRIINFEFDPTLLFINMVLQNAHGTFNTRFQSMKGGPEQVLKIDDKIFQALIDEIDQLRKNIEKESVNAIYLNLQKIMILIYVTTGNGNYMYSRGQIKI